MGGGLSYTTGAAGANLRISGSTFSGNNATGNGGGGLRVTINNGAGQGYITNSTISGNTNTNPGSSGGGGIFVQSDGFVVTNSTITENSTAGGGGGGIRVSLGKSATLNGTIIGGNSGTDANDVSGDIVSGSAHNLIGDGTGVSGISNGTDNNIVGTAAMPVNARLAPLGNYGGTTRTHALLPGSPALNAAGAACPANPPTTAPLAVDQRGVPRPQPTAGGVCDIGAFESRGFTLTASAGATQQTTAGRPFPIALAATLAPVDAGDPVSGATVTFTINPIGGATGTFAGGMTTATAATNANGVATASALTAGSTAGSFAVTTSIAGAANATHTLTVNPLPTITTTTLPATTQGVAYDRTVMATGGTSPLTFTATGLPTGLMVGMTGGAITGTPTASGTSTIMVTVTDAAGATAMQSLTLTVNPPVAISATALPAATRNRPYDQTVMATGGTGTPTYAATGLPAGLMIGMSTGAITGTPTAASSAMVTITVTDGVGATAMRMLTLVVNPAPTITTTTLADAVSGLSYNQTVATAGGTAPFTFGVTGLPTGLMMNTMTGAITGTTTATGMSTVTVTVADTNGAGATRMLTLNVNNPAPTLTALSPNTMTPGSPAFTLTVAGTGFVNGAIVRFDGSPLTTTFVSSTRLTAQVPASMITVMKTYVVVVTNPTPVTASNTVPFTVAIVNAAPVLRSTAPVMGMQNAVPGLHRTVTPIPGGTAPAPNPPRR